MIKSMIEPFVVFHVTSSQPPMMDSNVMIIITDLIVMSIMMSTLLLMQSISNVRDSDRASDANDPNQFKALE